MKNFSARFQFEVTVEKEVMKLLPQWAFSIVDKWLSQWTFQLRRQVDFTMIAIMAVQFGKILLDRSEDDAL